MIVNAANVKSIHCNKSFCPVPPSPKLLLQLFVNYKGLKDEGKLPHHLTFEDYYYVWLSSRRGENYVGLDDGKTKKGSSSDLQLIDRPPKELKGTIKTVVLLVDFDDKPHSSSRNASYYREMLFGDIDVFPTGSMAEYYRRISNYNISNGTTGINIGGEVHGWIRLPRTSNYYTADSTGTGEYPYNAQGMAEDAVKAALEQGVSFTGYDVLGEGFVTALFIIHAGRGAEETNDPNDFWSLKWILNKEIEVSVNLSVKTFLTVPEDCQVGVCAHEWGHLAARWADFYDTGKSKFTKSNGLGNYCLMASGSWNNYGITPCLPNGMLRMFHNWITPKIVTNSEKNIVVKPASEGGSIVLIHNTAFMKDEQYVFVEYRRRTKQDTFLPDEGLAIYTVDENIDNVNDESNLAVEIIQADNKRDLAKVFGQGNRGDGEDLYPSVINGYENRLLGQNTEPPLNLNGIWTGITIEVTGNPSDSEMMIDVTITPQVVAKVSN
ncbi:M6 family metalloprotease domain-containing protein [Pontibacter diazotrophicus]|uniref:M6 family metalloprotease domain-containing protein n=2 Tax=Pontibacter diazotrophicus TaxID=1400979 RepID=A0A3D8LHV2_9BACT|nr:M6 family metalloprotease domain-containing protein [Pontibacter diazotrophicus]